MTPAPRPFDPSDYLRVADFARERNVQSKVIRDWLERRGLKRAPYYLRRGLYGYVRFDLAAEYAAPRETARPKGWPTLKSLKADLALLPSGSGVNYLERRIATGELRVVTYRKVRYVDPDDYRRVVLLYKDRLPPAGLVLLRDLARETGRDPVAVVLSLHNEVWVSDSKRQGVEYYDLEAFLATRYARAQEVTQLIPSDLSFYEYQDALTVLEARL